MGRSFSKPKRSFNSLTLREAMAENAARVIFRSAATKTMSMPLA